MDDDAIPRESSWNFCRVALLGLCSDLGKPWTSGMPIPDEMLAARDEWAVAAQALAQWHAANEAIRQGDVVTALGLAAGVGELFAEVNADEIPLPAGRIRQAFGTRSYRALCRADWQERAERLLDAVADGSRMTPAAIYRRIARESQYKHATTGEDFDAKTIERYLNSDDSDD